MATAPDIALGKKLTTYAWIATAAVVALVVIMREVSIPLPEDLSFSFLPPIYSTFNALTAVLLIVGLVFIKQKKMEQHKKAMFIALISSILFLLCYVLYHFTTDATVFGDTDHNGILSVVEKEAVAGIRPFYLILLLSHILLAAFSLPFILITFIRAYTNQIAKHRRMAKWVFPIWLYVAITGPICYLMLIPYYA